MFLQYRKHIIAVFVLLSFLSIYFASKLTFNFSFEQFFPQGDEDLAYFESFIEDFESDDNYLLLSVENQPSVFDSVFLNRFHGFSLDLRKLPHVKKVQSLTTMRYPLKTPFGVSMLPIIEMNKPHKYEENKRLVLSDPRFVHSLISESTDILTIIIKTKEQLTVEESHELIEALERCQELNNIKDLHLVGRAFFQHELVQIQQWEIVRTSILSAILVILFLVLLFRRKYAVLIALISIGISLVIFMGVLGLIGKPLDMMSAFYPVLMIIVGTSDIIHIMTKHIRELNKGKTIKDALSVTIKEIGLATLLTSLTTAAGFVTLLTSKVGPIQTFGVNSAIGVIIAYVTIILFSTSLLSFFSVDQLSYQSEENDKWNKLLNKIHSFTATNNRRILVFGLLFIGFCLYGISKITTNYQIISNLPKGEKVTEDFLYFEKNLAGFRPLEVAIIVKEGSALDYEVQKEIAKIETFMHNTGVIQSIMSHTTLFKSLNRMNNANQAEAYKFPESKSEFIKLSKMVDRMLSREITTFVSKDEKKARISSRIADIGAENIKTVNNDIKKYVEQNINTDLLSIRITGTGVIIDKNAEYITDSLFKGLGLAIFIVSLMMMFLFRNIKMLFVSFLTNLIPVLFAAAILGYFRIPLEASVSITFAIIFGIAVDDTIHFLSKFKLAYDKMGNLDKAIRMSYIEAGKAISFTTIILFFGFLVMLFSSNPPSIIIGSLIAITLISAWACDMYILPALLRSIYGKNKTH